MRKLTLIHILEYYDVPQILIAVDAMNTHYLCTLYSTDSNGYQYLGVQISEPRLLAFIGGQIDLRETYLRPEVDNALYMVSSEKGQLTADKLIQSDEISEDMLPEAGYYFDNSDLTEESEMSSDTYQLSIPAYDRATFSTLISRMGWSASSLRKTIGKIAVL